jgi:hypothetical protein
MGHEPSFTIDTNSPSARRRKPRRPTDRFGPLPTCRIITLPRIKDPRGNLTFIEGGHHVPFDVERVYYLYDVPGGAERGGHAHRDLHQAIIAVSGSFDVILDDGFDRKKFRLSRSYRALYVAPMVWRELKNFSSGSVCLVLASAPYEEADYIREFDEFVRLARGRE